MLSAFTGLAPMKTPYFLAGLVLTLSLLACDEVKQKANEHLDLAKESARQKMNAGAEKLAEGVKEMADQAKLEAQDHVEKLKQDGAKALDEAAKAAQEAADRLKASSPAAQ
jgi:hypothetical protein